MILINKHNVIKISKNLENELKVYKNNNQNVNIPKLLYYKKEIKQHILIIKNTGLNLINVYNQLSLYDLNNLYNDIKTTLDYLHYYLKVVHRDIKPENITYKNKQFYLIDFNLSNDIKNITNNFIGNIKFCSLQLLKNIKNNIFNIQVIINNDYISLLYTIWYIYKRELPWKNDKDKITNLDIYLNFLNKYKTKNNFENMILKELKKYNEF